MDVYSKTFPECIKSVFLSNVAKVCGERQIDHEDAALLMENGPSDLTGKLLDVLTTATMRVLTFARHTTQIFQPLDLMSSGAFK
jgi:hypothetical protein